MKTLRKILIGIFTTVVIFSTTASAFSTTIPNVSNFTPNRQGVEFITGQQGFTYPTFNNFTSNPNISSGGREGDERKFLVGKYCEDGTCEASDLYYNTLINPLKEGDKVRFEIYFHNNGDDPYDGGTTTNDNAQNVQVGIDLKNIVDTTYSDLLHPKAFISADNNQYRTDKNSISTVLKDANGNIIRTATDDMQVFINEDTFKLQPVIGSAFLTMKTSTNNFFDESVLNSTNITFDTVTPDTYTINVSPHYESDKMWLQFDELPGCFRYSGTVYFDAIVTAPSTPPPTPKVCEELQLQDFPDTVNGVPAKRLEATPNFAPDGIPITEKLIWTSSDLNGKFYTKTGNTFTEIATTVNGPEITFTQNPETVNVPLFGTVVTFNDIYYVGSGSIYVRTLSPSQCYALLNIPPQETETPICADINVNYQNPILIDTVSEFKSTSTDNAGNVFEGGEITYSVDEGYGFFSTESCGGWPVNPSGFTTTSPLVSLPYKTIPSTPTNLKTINTKFLQTNITSPNSLAFNLIEQPLVTQPIININEPVFETAKPQFDPNQPIYQLNDKPQFELLQPQYTLIDYSSLICDKQSTLTVPYGTKVYFHGEKAGTDVIHVTTTNTNVAACSEDFSVTGTPVVAPVCTDLTLASATATINNETGLKLTTSLSFNPQAIPTGTKLQWKTTDPNGKFFIPLGTGYRNVSETTDGTTISYLQPAGTTFAPIFYVGSGTVSVDTIAANGTKWAECSASITISAPVCSALTLTSDPATINGEAGFELLSSVSFEPNPIPVGTKLQWTTTDPNGKFFIALGTGYRDVSETTNSTTISYLQATTEYTIAGQANFLAFKEIYYVGSGTVSVETIATDGSAWANCSANITIPNVEAPVCTELNVTNWVNSLTETLTILSPGKVYELTANANYDGTVTPQTVTFTSDSGVFIEVPQNPDPNAPPNIISNGIILATYRAIANDIIGQNLNSSNYTATTWPVALETELTVNDGATVFFITFANASNTSNALTIQATDRNESACIKTYPINENLICTDLSVLNWNNGISSALVELEAAKSYKLTSEANYSQLLSPATSTYTSGSGVFVEVPQNPDPNAQPGISDGVIEAAYRALINDFIVGKVTSTNYNGTNWPLPLNTELTVPDGNFVFFITFTDAVATNNALTVKATNRTETICTKTFPIPAIPEPPEETSQCVNIEIITPATPWRITESEASSNSNEERFQIELTTFPEGESDKYDIRWESSDGNWQDGETTSGQMYNTLEDFGFGTDVDIWAINPDGSRAELCTDTVSVRTEDEPEITKLVYPEDVVDDADDILNISNSESYLTYVLSFSPGNVASSAAVIEAKLNNGEIQGSLEGNLEFRGMRINVVDGNNEYTILKTNEYEDDSDNNNPLGDNNYNENNNQNLSDFEDDYKCETNKLCIVGNFDDVVNDFKDGKAIKFKNLNTLSDNSAIFIKYQMKNNTAISEERCKNLTKADGCGELFPNEVSFEAWCGDDFTDDNCDGNWKGDDNAEVIAICPFILTRSGGDAFFKDVLDVGVDVAECSEVKGGDNVVVTPRQEDEQELESTGQGGKEVLTLDLPSHDVCRYSNMESNIEGYNDVLKNFSSTVCELKAEVSEIWTEENINKAIAANITRIARWGGNINILDTIRSIADLNLVDNNESGVFVKDNGKDLVIDLSSNKLTATSETPGAQTYIVKNANLIIKSDIKYGDTNFLDPKSTPSVAFIVIDGNIIINNNVKHIDGVIMAVDLDNDGSDGKITNGTGETTKNILTINGNLIGNVFDLFNVRRGVGDPTKDEGSVTIRYDERILINTPPGLSELIDVSQLRVAQ